MNASGQDRRFARDAPRPATGVDRGNKLASCMVTYGMQKTTIYLPDDLKQRLEKIARATGRPEAALIRDAIRSATQDAAAPRPRVPLMNRGLGNATIAENVDALLDEKFGR
jgi:ribbon-helix-helix CopG family protein